MNQLESVQTHMNLISLRQRWEQLRELVFSGTDELTVLEFIDRTLQTLPKTEHFPPQTLQIQHLNRQLRNNRNTIQQLKGQNTRLEESSNNMRIDLEMVGIKCRKLLKNLQELNRKILRMERRDRKQLEKEEIQSETLSYNESSFCSTEIPPFEYEITRFNEICDQSGPQSDQTDQLEDQHISQELLALQISLNSSQTLEDTNNPEQSEQSQALLKLFQFALSENEDQAYYHIQMDERIAESQHISNWLLTPSCRLFNTNEK